MSKDITRRISIFINDKEVENSLKGVEGAISQTRNSLRKLQLGSEEYDTKSKELKTTMDQLKQKQADYREELGFTQRELKNTSESSIGLRSSLTGIFDSLVSGDLQGAKAGLLELKEGMGGLLKSSLAFIASPIGLAIAALAGIAAGAKAIFDFNVQAEKSAQLIENLSGKTGQVVEDIRVKMQALTDTFDVSFEQLAGAVDNLVDTGVAKDELEALTKIKQGLLTAPNKNEFIASLESSAVTAKQVGLSLEEVIGLKQAIEETGVNPEATFGALEKAGRNLALQTDVLRKSLTDAFGASFTDDILAKVKTGQLTTVDALELINKKSKEVGLNQTQQAELGKEIFGKAAQSAGGYAVILDTVSNGIKKQGQELNGNQKALSDLEVANEKLGKAQSELFRVKDFGEIWTKVKVMATDALADIITYISDLKKDIQPLIDLVGIAFSNAWQYTKTIVVGVFDVISGVLKAFSNTISTAVQFFKKIFEGDFRGALDVVKNGFINFGNIVSNTFAKIKNTVIDALKSIVSNVAPFIEAIGLDVSKINKLLDGLKSKEINITSNSKANASGENPEKAVTKLTEEELQKQKNIRDAARQKEIDAQQKARDKKKADQEKADKEDYDRAKALADAKANLAKAELEKFIIDKRSNLDKDKALTPEIIAAEIARLQSVKNAQINFNNQERDRKILELEQKSILEKTSQETLNIQKEAINLEYENKNQELSLAFQQSTDALKKQYEEEQKVLKAEQLLLDNELAIAEADTKFEADKIKQDQDYQAQLSRFKTLFEGKKITEAEYDRFVAVAKLKQDELDNQRELQKVQGTLGGLNQLAGAVGELFGQSKELALVQAGINGAMAITSILAQYPKFDGGFAMTAAIVAAGITTVAQVAKITTTKPPKTPKFFYGGDTGSAASLGYDEYGPVTGYVHKNEYVIPEIMTASPRYANTIAWLEQERKQKLRGYVDGGSTSSNIPTTVTQENNTEMSSLLKAVLNRLENPIAPNLLFGHAQAKKINELNDETNNSNQNGIVS